MSDPIKTEGQPEEPNLEDTAVVKAPTIEAKPEPEATPEATVQATPEGAVESTVEALSQTVVEAKPPEATPEKPAAEPAEQFDEATTLMPAPSPPVAVAAADEHAAPTDPKVIDAEDEPEKTQESPIARHVPDEETTSPMMRPAPTPPKHVGPGEVALHLVGRTDVGLVREHNEDNFACVRLDDDSRDPAVLLHHTLGPQGTLLVVCDGMGGAAAGEVASSMAVATVPEVMRSDATGLAPAGVVDDEHTQLARKLRHATEEANRRIFLEQQANPARSGMGTTMTAALLRGDHAIIAQVGDSRCYFFRAGTLTQVTRDQSLVNQLLETGQITAEQAKYFEHSNVILQALGVQEDVEVQLSRVALRNGDRIMLCSDGLVGVITDEEIAAVMGSVDDPDEASRLLIELANGAGGPDNITVVVAHVGCTGLGEPTAEDTIVYSTWVIDPPREEGAVGNELSSLDSEPTQTEELTLPKGDTPHETPHASAISPPELFSMSLIIGLIAGSLLLGSALYRRGVPCEVRSSRAGMVVVADGHDSGARTVEGSVAVRLRPGRHSVGLAYGKRDASGAVPPHQDLDVAAGQACVVSFEEPTAIGEPETAP